MMSRKHYEAIAEKLKANNASSKLILDLATIFQDDNPERFNVSKFIEASK